MPDWNSRGGVFNYALWRDRDAFASLDDLIDTEYSEVASDKIVKSRRMIKTLSKPRSVNVRGTNGRIVWRNLPALPPAVLATALGCTVEHIKAMLSDSDMAVRAPADSGQPETVQSEKAPANRDGFIYREREPAKWDEILRKLMRENVAGSIAAQPIIRKDAPKS